MNRFRILPWDSDRISPNVFKSIYESDAIIPNAPFTDEELDRTQTYRFDLFEQMMSAYIQKDHFLSLNYVRNDYVKRFAQPFIQYAYERGLETIAHQYETFIMKVFFRRGLDKYVDVHECFKIAEGYIKSIIDDGRETTQESLVESYRQVDKIMQSKKY